MNPCLSRIGLALVLVALAPVCAAQSYAVLLKNPLEDDNHLHITNSKGTFGINEPGFGAAVGKRIETVHRYSPEQVKADFSDAMNGMSSILAAGLPPLSHSYIALLEMPGKPTGKLAFGSEQGNVLLDKAGQGVLVDGYSGDSFMVDMQAIRKDFGPALESLDEIIKAGFHTSYIVLLESPDGSVGKVIFSSTNSKTTLDEKGEAVDMGVAASDSQLFKVEESQLKNDFGNAIESRPILPAKYVLHFQAGSTKLAEDSQEQADKLLEDVKNRPAADITINGHTDTVGRDALNDKLSQKRAEFVAALIRSKGVEPRALEIDHHGKRLPLVATPDNTPELRNRRVEVVVR